MTNINSYNKIYSNGTATQQILFSSSNFSLLHSSALYENVITLFPRVV